MRWFVLLLLFFGAVINFADKSIIGFATAPIMKEFHLSYTEWGLVGSSYYWLYPFSGIFGAAMADRYGVKKILAVVMLSWTVLQFGVLAIAALPLLIVYRVFLGAFEGPYSPIAYSHADRWFPPKLRGFANSVIVGGGTVGAMIVAPVLVALIAMLGWKMAFASLGLASFVWFFLFTFLTKENPVNAYNEVQKIKREKAKNVKLKDVLSVLAAPTALFTTLAYFSAYILVVWFPVWMPIYLVDVVKMSNAQMGLSVAVMGIVSVIVYTGVSMISDYLFKKSQNWRASRVYFIAFMMILGGAFLASLVVFHHPIWVVVALCFAKGLTYSILPIGPTIMINEMRERGGLMTSILTSTGNLAGIIAPLITGYIISFASGGKIAGYNLTIMFMAGIVFLFSLLFAIFVKPATGSSIYRTDPANVILGSQLQLLRKSSTDSKQERLITYKPEGSINLEKYRMIERRILFCMN